MRPAGLLAGLSPLTAAATGTLTDKIAADVKTLLTAIAPALVPVLIVSTVEAAVLDVAAPGLAKIGSVSVVPGSVLAIDASAFLSAMGPADFAVSEQAVVHEEDAAPLPLVGGTAQPPVIGSVAAPSWSLWQTDAIGLRTILDVNWALRRSNAVAYMQNVGW